MKKISSILCVALFPGSLSACAPAEEIVQTVDVYNRHDSNQFDSLR